LSSDLFSAASVCQQERDLWPTSSGQTALVASERGQEDLRMVDFSTERAANALTAETLTGRLVAQDGEVFQFETDEGERIVITLGEASGVRPHHLEGIVRSPARITVTIEGPHEHATATRVGPCEQYHPGPPPPWGIRMTGDGG
jgi:hypothetical protein